MGGGLFGGEKYYCRDDPDFRRHLKLEKQLIQGLVERVKAVDASDRTTFDVPKLTEVFVDRGVGDTHAFNVLYRLMHRHLDLFEPVDYARAARAMRRVDEHTGYRDSTLTNAVGRRSLHHWDEFSGVDWHAMVCDLKALGVRHDILSSLEAHKRDLPLMRVFGENELWRRSMGPSSEQQQQQQHELTGEGHKGQLAQQAAA
mmetsp:Transcript_21824/g.62113  ORF Transcript_21824/g.62113 Transcript_21824/m.62113 type:complete len:201 (+) Transcript_21824:3-605(+)